MVADANTTSRGGRGLLGVLHFEPFVYIFEYFEETRGALKYLDWIRQNAARLV